MDMHPDIRPLKHIALILIMIMFVVIGAILPPALQKASEKSKEDKFYAAGSYQASKKAGNVGNLFESEGYIVETNTGKAFLYELPGIPAIRKALVLDRSSICDFGGEASACSADLLTAGIRAKVTGILDGELIKVKRITLVNKG